MNTLIIDRNREFIKEKIMQVKTALCFIDHEKFLLQTHIVQTLRVDDEGNIWFLLIMPSIPDENINHFMINLTYYRKAFDFYLKVKARATIAEEESQGLMIDEKGKLTGYKKTMLVKAKIIEVNYT